MIDKQSRLDIAEYFSIGALFFGLVTTAITKQLLYSLTPLAFSLLFNNLNLQKYKKQSNLSLEQSQQIENLHHDLINFSDDYKYQKLELESLIKEAKEQEIKLNRASERYIDKTEISSVLNQLGNLETSKVEFERKIQVNIQTIESRIKKIENSESEFNSGYQSSIGQSTTLTGLTQYYPLQGLTQKLIKEGKNCQDIKYSQRIEGNKILNESILKYVQKVAKHSQYLSEVVITYYNDHECSRQEAEQLSAELNQLAMEISMIRSIYDLRLMYKVINLFTHQISQFQHRKSKYRWNNSMREKMLNVLNDCLAKI